MWPRRSLLAECDPAGGDIALRLSGPGGRALRADAGLVSLATAARDRRQPVDVWQHTQDVDGGLPVLLGPESPAQAMALSVGWQPAAATLASVDDADVIADCGRLSPGAVCGPVLAGAALLVLLVRASVEQLAHLRHALTSLADIDGSRLSRTVVAVIAEGRTQQRHCADVADALAAGFPQVSVLAGPVLDPAGAAGLCGVWTRRLDRSPLIGSARSLAQHLDVRLATPVATDGEWVPMSGSGLPLAAVLGDEGTEAAWTTR